MQSLILLASLLLLAQGPSGVVVPVTLNGRITVDDASPVPTVETFRGPNVLVGLQAIPADGTNQLAEAMTRADGTFALTVTTAAGIGRFGIHVSRIPLGLYVKSMSYGSVDILQAPLDISRNRTPEEIRIVLTKTPPSAAIGGVKLSGRVTKLENTAPGTSLMISLQTTSGGSNQLRLGVFPSKADGTFEIQYFRGCDGNCGRLGAPEVFCSAPITVKSGDVLYAERIVQNAACTIRVYSPQR